MSIVLKNFDASRSGGGPRGSRHRAAEGGGGAGVERRLAGRTELRHGDIAEDFWRFHMIQHDSTGFNMISHVFRGFDMIQVIYLEKKELTGIWWGISWDIWPTISNLGSSESRVPHYIHWSIVVWPLRRQFCGYPYLSIWMGWTSNVNLLWTEGY